jgi:rod shape-determining protein MreD
MAIPAWQARDIGLPARLVPGLTTLLFALVSVVPLHVPGLAIVTPAFMLMAVYHWTIYRPDLLPLGAIFALGLLLDLLSGTPYVGISALTLLLARTALLANRRHFVNRTFPVLWGGFLALAAGAFAFEWALLSLLYKTLLSIRPVVFQAVLTVACFPVGSYLLARAHRAFLARA